MITDSMFLLKPSLSGCGEQFVLVVALAAVMGILVALLYVNIYQWLGLLGWWCQRNVTDLCVQ